MNDLPLTILDSNELYTGSKRIHSISAASLPDDPYVVALCTKIDKGTSDMEKAMGKALKSNFTSVLLEKDTVRDYEFIGLRDFVKSFLHNKVAAKATAATKLSTIIKTIGNRIYNLGYVDETAKMNTLINTLKGPEPTQFLQTLAATDRFLDMEAAQVDFEKTYKLKIDTESDIDLPLLKDAKARISEALNALLIYVGSNVEFNAAKFSPIEIRINEVITDIVSIARARITRIEAEKKKADEAKKTN